ncbi:MAG TPA: diguanylate cyclase [Albitalea sp.]|nr:diguanylate cyclase [Albitalea sp.]
MREAPDRDGRQAPDAPGELALVRAQTLQARAELRQLQRDIADAEACLGRTEAAQLLEANEQLVLGMLRAGADAETAAQALSAASHSAGLDALTGLPNRVLLRDRLAQAIGNAKRHGSRAAVLFLDLDNFKQVNDALGHAGGDQLLKRTAHRLGSAVRAADTVSRHGGDEFVILLSEVSEASDAALIAQKLLLTLTAYDTADASADRIDASIGISIYPDDGADVDTLIDAADAAMYHVKRHRPGSFAFSSERAAGEGGIGAAVLAALPRPVSARELAATAHDRQHMTLRDANERLVLATLGAQQLQHAAELAWRRQTQLLAVVAHELRNPLSPIRAAAALLGRVEPEELPRLKGIIERQVMRVTRLASDLLDVSRANTGKLRLEPARVDLAGILDEALDTCRPAMDLRLQRLRVQLPAFPLELHADSARLAQVFSNLLDNASKYTPQGGEIVLSVAADGDSAAITVSDNGIGITPQAAADVFDPFVQEPHAVNFNGLGLGLGLTVVRELVAAHGGSVVASSAGAGLGSKFVVTLPLAT